MTTSLIVELAKVKAMFQQRAILSAMGVRQRDLVAAEVEQCNSCEGSGLVFVRRNRKGEIDYIDGSPTNEEISCDACRGEGVR
jgi:hypothetical protein